FDRHLRIHELQLDQDSLERAAGFVAAERHSGTVRAVLAGRLADEYDPRAWVAVAMHDPAAAGHHGWAAGARLIVEQPDHVLSAACGSSRRNSRGDMPVICLKRREK